MTEFRQMHQYGFEPMPWQIKRIKENCEAVLIDLVKAFKQADNTNSYVVRELILKEINTIQRLIKRVQKKHPQNFI